MGGIAGRGFTREKSSVPWVGEIAAEGGRVVVITHNETQDEDDYRVLHVLDVSDPTQPRIQASSILRYLYLEYDPDPVEVVLAGDTAIIAQQGGLWSADVGDPAGIRWVSDIQLTWPVTHLAKSGDRVYTAQADGSVRTYDATDPRALREIGMLQGWAPNHYMDVFAVSNGLILAAREEGDVHLIRDTETGDLVKSPTTYLPSGASDLVVADGRAYLATGRGLSILDVTDPGSPQLLGWSRAVSGALAVEGRLLYSFDKLGGLRVVDVGDPAAVVEIGHLAEVGARVESSGSAPKEIELRGDLAIVGINGGRVSVVDVSQPAAPRLRGVVDTRDGGYPYNMAASETHVYVPMGGHWHVIDIRDPDAPRLVETRSRPDTYPFGIAVAGGHLFVTSRMEDDSDRSLLEVFDLADPAHPPLIGETMLPENTDSSVAVEGSLAYAGGIAGIAVVDVGDPSEPRLVNPGLPLAWAGRPDLYHVASLWGWDARPVVAAGGYVFANGLTIARFRPATAPIRCYLPMVGGPARN